ncbi:hypothetical protein [Congregicoccus parvus]|uniref:hypothetical protein n=1 Tax=Congregicoccus parvus TaxID=3081749 RepID=UPI003FA5A01C
MPPPPAASVSNTDEGWSVDESEAIGAVSDDSFENAAPVSREALRSRLDQVDEDSASASGDGGDATGATKPTLEDMLAKLPEENRRTVDELFRGRFTAVRRLDRRRLV